ncbi:hypothetical protein [Ureibacillus manganicus]|nr:hypothetical protein [Ureibacillus manganicus]
MNPYEPTKTLSDDERQRLKEELIQILEQNTLEEIEVALCQIIST